jgi:hypothetical protein
MLLFVVVGKGIDHRYLVSQCEEKKKWSGVEKFSSSSSSDLRIKTLKTSPVDIQFSSIREEEDISYENLTLYRS